MEAVRIVSGLGFVAAFFTGAILSVLFFERAKTVRRGQRFSLLVVGDGVKAKLLRNGIKPLRKIAQRLSSVPMVDRFVSPLCEALRYCVK